MTIKQHYLTAFGIFCGAAIFSFLVSRSMSLEIENKSLGVKVNSPDDLTLIEVQNEGDDKKCVKIVLIAKQNNNFVPIAYWVDCNKGPETLPSEGTVTL